MKNAVVPPPESTLRKTLHHVPHRFPFEWIDTCEPGLARVRLTATGPFGRVDRFPEILMVEILAQGCLAGLSAARVEEVNVTGSRETQGGLLAGIDQVTFLPVLRQRPLAAGDSLEVAVEQTAAFGRLIKVHGILRRGKETLVEGDLMLASS